MDFSGINPWAILVAALSNFLVGGLWYSPLLFAKRWMKEIGLTEEELQKANMPRIFGLTFVFSLVIAVNLAFFQRIYEPDWGTGALVGAMIGLGWVTMSMATNALFERRSLVYVLIHMGNAVVSYAVMGAIIGAWR
ncbi:MAG: DUF1761 domain-containing protein [Bacteroidota bacterium]